MFDFTLRVLTKRLVKPPPPDYFLFFPVRLSDRGMAVGLLSLLLLRVLVVVAAVAWSVVSYTVLARRSSRWCLGTSRWGLLFLQPLRLHADFFRT